MSKNIQLSLLLVALLSPLHAQNITLEPITVTSATKTTQSIQDVTSSINVISAEELEEKHYKTVPEALNSISGINFTSNGGFGQATSVMIRGFDSKRVLVVIDGIRYNDVTGLSGAPFEHLMVSNIERIEIVKGAQSGIWGADATAGVINIITKSAQKGLHGFLNAEYGSFNTKKYGGGASYKTDGFYLKASVEKTDTNSFSAQAPKGENLDQYEDDGYRNTNSNIKLGFNINETNKIDFSHTIINSHGDSDQFNAPDSTYPSRVNNTFSKINFNHIDSFNEVNIYASNSKFDRDYPDGWTKEFDGEVNEYGIQSNISYNEKDFLTLGADYKNFEHQNDFNQKYNNKAIFITNSNLFNCPIGGKLILTESLRYDRYSTFDNKTTAKLGLKRIITNDLSISANYGTAYNIPTLFDLNDPTYGNQNLTAEDTKSYDISIEYKDLKATYFSSKIEDMISFDPITYVSTNIEGTTKLKGIELEYSTNLNQDISITSSYTYLDAKNNDNERLRRRPKGTFKLSADYYGISDLHIGVQGEYIGSRYDNDNEKGEQTGKYTLLNLVANYNINKDLLIYTKIDNVFDKYYQVADGYASAPLSAYIGMKVTF